MFPFLIGTVRTQSVPVPLLSYLCVSIPHRYGKNTNSVTNYINFSLFPFLIGTVRTFVMMLITNSEESFHSS
mgnify:FL=1